MFNFKGHDSSYDKLSFVIQITHLSIVEAYLSILKIVQE